MYGVWSVKNTEKEQFNVILEKHLLTEVFRSNHYKHKEFLNRFCNM